MDPQLIKKLYNRVKNSTFKACYNMESFIAIDIFVHDAVLYPYNNAMYWRDYILQVTVMC